MICLRGDSGPPLQNPGENDRVTSFEEIPPSQSCRPRLNQPPTKQKYYIRQGRYLRKSQWSSAVSHIKKNVPAN